MNNQTGNVSLAALSGSFLNTTSHTGSNVLSAEILESTLENLLQVYFFCSLRRRNNTRD